MSDSNFRNSLRSEGGPGLFQEKKSTQTTSCQGATTSTSSSGLAGVSELQKAADFTEAKVQENVNQLDMVQKLLADAREELDQLKRAKRLEMSSASRTTIAPGSAATSSKSPGSRAPGNSFDPDHGWTRRQEEADYNYDRRIVSSKSYDPSGSTRRQIFKGSPNKETGLLKNNLSPIQELFTPKKEVNGKVDDLDGQDDYLNDDYVNQSQGQFQKDHTKSPGIILRDRITQQVQRLEKADEVTFQLEETLRNLARKTPLSVSLIDDDFDDLFWHVKIEEDFEQVGKWTTKLARVLKTGFEGKLKIKRVWQGSINFEVRDEGGFLDGEVDEEEVVDPGPSSDEQGKEIGMRMMKGLEKFVELQQQVLERQIEKDKEKEAPTPRSQSFQFPQAESQAALGFRTDASMRDPASLDVHGKPKLLNRLEFCRLYEQECMARADFFDSMVWTKEQKATYLNQQILANFFKGINFIKGNTNRIMENFFLNRQTP